jgi:hypothetical protein
MTLDTLDTLDAAFVRRWQALPTGSPPPPSPAPPLVTLDPVPYRAASVVPLAPPPSACTQDSMPDAAPLVDRLLADAACQWQVIADRVEAARSRGRRVIAVAGCERGEGRTTIVAALIRVLQSRGRDVIVGDPAHPAAHAGPTHDKRIVLVDAGVWFPPGPIRRPRLLVASYGCEAAILVRRADRPATPAIEAALAAIGIESLGEVVTFATTDAEAEKDA